MRRASPDPRVVREYAARESIATSSGQNDSGLFELSFRDERYLPFEYLGAVSRWRIELPPENNYFDFDTVTDLVLHLNYTARDGGAALREAAARDARGRLPGDGLRLFDVRHDFPDAWPALRHPGGPGEPSDDRERHGRDRERSDPDGWARRLRLGFTRAMFPFVPGRPVDRIDQLVLMFAAPDAAPGAHHLIRFWRDEAGHGDAAQVECVAGDAWPGLFCGAIDLREHPLGPLRDGQPTACTFEIPCARRGDPERLRHRQLRRRTRRPVAQATRHRTVRRATPWRAERCLPRSPVAPPSADGLPAPAGPGSADGAAPGGTSGGDADQRMAAS